MKLSEIINEVDKKEILTEEELQGFINKSKNLLEAINILDKVIDNVLKEEQFIGRPAELQFMSLEELKKYDFVDKEEIDEIIKSGDKKRLWNIFNRLVKINANLQGIADEVDTDLMAGRYIPKNVYDKAESEKMDTARKNAVELAKHAISKYKGEVVPAIKYLSNKIRNI